MNKKLAIPLFAILLIGGVLAVASFYGQVHDILGIYQPISIYGDGQNVQCDAGQVCLGSEIRIDNYGSNEVEMLISTNYNSYVQTRYVGFLDLTKKDSEWTPTGETTSVKFAIVGDSFEYEADLPEGYVLVYAKDHQDRVNDPAEFVRADDISFDIAQSDDWNIGDDADYCNSDGYEHCKGAKLWAVPESDLNTDGTLNWENMENYFWESDLIFYFHNGDKTIVVPAESFITFYPEYTVDKYVADGTQIDMITTVA